jgi:hypothetical protein
MFSSDDDGDLQQSFTTSFINTKDKNITELLLLITGFVLFLSSCKIIQ